MESIVDRMIKMARTKVYKQDKLQDDRKSLCGEPLQEEKCEDGTVRYYFAVPTQLAQEFCETHSYIKGEDFLLEPKKDDTQKRG